MARKLPPTDSGTILRDRILERMRELDLTPYALSTLSGVAKLTISRFLKDGEGIGVIRFLRLLPPLGLSLTLTPVEGYERPKVLPRGRPRSIVAVPPASRV